MLRRRPLAILTSLAAIAVGLVAGAPSADAAPAITPWQSSVAVGAMFSATANGCPMTSEEGDTSYWYQSPEVRLLTGSGVDRRFAAFGQVVSGARVRLTVPGWVDPDQPAALVGRCVRTTYDFTTDTEVTETLFTYPEVAIDIVAGTPAMTGPLVTLSRTTAASGQAVRAEITGCEGADYASVFLLEGSDLTLGGDIGFVTGADGDVSGGTATFDLTLLRPDYSMADELGGGPTTQPIAEGPYTVLAACSSYDDEGDSSIESFSAPQLLTVSGTSPSGAISYEVGDDAISIAGEQCTGGRTVTISYRTYGIAEGPVESHRAFGEALAQRDLVAAVAANAAVVGGNDEPGVIDATIEVTPEADGTWTAEVPIDPDLYVIEVTATCGDPLADGFSYGARLFYLGGGYADVYADRVSPTSSPVGGQVAAYLYGDCEDGATVTIGRGDEVLAESSSVVPTWTVPSKVTLTAPSSPGTYDLRATCDGEVGDWSTYEVFTPDEVSAEAPLAADPTEGWPSQGSRETYHGKIGPITLPPMEMGDMASTSGSKAMGPSGLFIDVPKPEGDFAITKIDIDLVDADGMTVPATSAHLHHFVFGASNGTNPACPNGSTFGIPGSIVAAAGAEKTVLDIGDPYGMVVKGTDTWKGVYELMSRSMESQEVYLTYDLTYRRDVSNVRPVVRYFGSATGCSTFNWTIDGSGTPDTQSTYIEIQKSGRLVGGGAHIHNGAAYADIVNDRDRLLCRSEITYGSNEVGHAMPMLKRAMDEETTTTMVDDDPMVDDDYPPEFYDDDLEIAGISSCALAESVTAGERIRFDTVYENDRARSGVMGIYTLMVWEGGGPAAPGPDDAVAVPGSPSYTG